MKFGLTNKMLCNPFKTKSTVMNTIDAAYPNARIHGCMIWKIRFSYADNLQCDAYEHVYADFDGLELVEPKKIVKFSQPEKIAPGVDVDIFVPGIKHKPPGARILAIATVLA